MEDVVVAAVPTTAGLVDLEHRLQTPPVPILEKTVV
jgi:hypothetical protein